jgi:glycosyltransferase involved in cell wall biosynthesis
MTIEERRPISVCIIAGNEAHRIGNTLKSVAGWTSEIIVVINAEVNDGTDKIAEEFGAKVFREPWKGFLNQKNSASEKCRQKWLLNLDADEVVTPELKNEIIAVVREDKMVYAAYEFPRCAFYCGRWIRHGDWYPDRVLRLWRRESARWGGIEPHTKLAVNGKIGRLKSDLLHFTNESITRQISKITFNHVAFVKRRRASGKSVGFFELAVRPPWRFLRAYFFRLGFLDGWQGFYIAKLSAFSTLTRYTMVREAEQEPIHPE